MAILGFLGRWALTPTGLAVCGLLGLLVAWKIDRAVQRDAGARAAMATVKEQDRRYVSKANAAADRSRDPGARGVLDPYARK
jgi:xanthosine utilization system XapX-like protein